MPRRAAPLLTLALVSALIAAPGRAQQGEGLRPTPGRFAPAPLAQPGWLAVLDTYTGFIHLAPAGQELGGAAWVIDPERCVRWTRPLAPDVSAGHPIATSLPVTTPGAGAPVFAWEPGPDGPGVLDTRSGVHYLLVGEPGACKVVRTDLRVLSRSVREVAGAVH